MESEDDIVITGIAGRYPKSSNVEEFAANLFNKVDMLDDDDHRWDDFSEEIPKRFGRVPNLKKFDTNFFSIWKKYANWTDPQVRCLLEHSYEAILDAGQSPQAFHGSKTGVFIGNSDSDSKDLYGYQVPTREGYTILGNATYNLANKISYIFGLQGPSMKIDTACSSSGYAMNHAFESIRNGSCDAALVGGTNLILTYNGAREFYRAHLLSYEGLSIPFDEKANGFVRAEVVGMVLIQKRRDAKRVYGTLINIGVNNDGYKEEGSGFPSRHVQAELIKHVYSKTNLTPQEVGYVEAHATGTLAGDQEEVAAIDAFFGKNREKPLIIGSVKSNMGHSEAGAFFASLTKVIVAFENEKIPPNWNLTSPRKDIEGFRDGRIKVATNFEEINFDYVSMNSFGLGGANSHAIIKRNPNKKKLGKLQNENLHRIVCWSGRTFEAVKNIFDELTKNPLDDEFVGLLQSSQVVTNYLNSFRGFGLFSHDNETNKASCFKQHVTQMSIAKKRPVVWCFNGIGSQWAGMAEDLMKIPTFAASIENSHQILKPRNFDLKKVITSKEVTFDNVLNSYVGIIAVEIALIDVLKSLGMEPDFMIGHSLGEIGCAYADNCFTAEEAICVAYERGRASNESKNIKGAMAAIGMNHNDLRKILPTGVEIGCQNSPDSTTITGCAEPVRKFMKELESKGIFTKEVPCSGVALHSSYISDFAKIFYANIKNLIKDPKKRSEKWISSSFHESLWSSEECQYSSAEYHIKNLINPVLFDEVTKKLPADSIVIEIGPHALLKSILKKSMPEATIFGLTMKNSPENSVHFLSSLGELFEAGIDMDLSKLYPSIKFPVSRGTRMISPLIKWNHEENFTVPISDRVFMYSNYNISINLNEKNYAFISDHIVDGKCILPAVFMITLVWDVFKAMFGNLQSNMKVEFENVTLTRATIIEKNQELLLSVRINRGTNYFEVTEKSALLMHGFVRQINSYVPFKFPKNNSKAVIISKEDFYKESRLCGYFHYGKFQGVIEARSDGSEGKLKWMDNWATFLDSMLQNFVVIDNKRGMKLPTFFGKIIFDIDKHFEEMDEDGVIGFRGKVGTVIAGGIEVHDFDANEVARRPEVKPLLESYKFIPNFSNEILSSRNFAKMCIQLFFENNLTSSFKSIEIDGNDEKFISEDLLKAIKLSPMAKHQMTLLTSRDLNIEGLQVEKKELSDFEDVDLIIGSEMDITNALKSLKPSGFLIIKNSKGKENFEGFKKVGRHNIKDFGEILMLQPSKISKTSEIAIEITSNPSEWIDKLKSSLKSDSTIILYSESPSGILGFFNCIRRESIGTNIKCVLIYDKNAPKFNLESSFYRSQLSLGFVMNVYKNGSWGTYRHFDLDTSIEPQPQSVDYFLRCMTKGDLSSLQWLHGSHLKSPRSIRVHYSAVNFKDLMLSLGRITPNIKLNRVDEYRILGTDFSGIADDGRRVFGLQVFGSLTTMINEDESIVWEVPDSWTLEQAATVPISYMTAYTAFFGYGNIKEGESILIHSGAGGVGQAAIQVALSYGLEVFTTVGSDEKRNFLLKKFNKLKPENIASSREAMEFETMIGHNTNYRGVDYVLNSLAGDKLHASIRCLAKGGTFFEIGKIDIHNRTQISMSHFANDITFKSFFLENLRGTKLNIDMMNRVADDVKRGIVIPIDAHTFPLSKSEEAFRFMASGKHMGKVLIQLRENENSIETLPIKARPNIFCYNNESMIIVGGLGGFGLELADLLVIRGCKNLILSSSRGVTTSYQAYKIEVWTSFGTKVIISTSDITTSSGCQELLNEASSLGPIGGIFNLAVNLQDAPFEEQTIESFEKSLKPKAIATKYLDTLSRLQCPSLRYFVVFSSVACGKGNGGQSNYGMANSIMERIIEERHADNLPGKAIQWGAIGEVGLLASAYEKNQNFKIGGTSPQSVASCLDAIDVLVNSKDPIVASMVIPESSNTSLDGKKQSILETVLNILGISDKKSINLDTRLSKLGVDSLMVVEIQQVLERDYDIVYSSQELRSLTLRQLDKGIKINVENEKELKLINDEKVRRGMFGMKEIKDEIIVAVPMNEASDIKALIIPGIEGVCNESLISIGSKLKCQAFVLQLATARHLMDIKEVFNFIINEVTEIFANDSKFMIVGYSYGSMLAMMIAGHLEALGKYGKVVMIDGSPKYAKMITQMMLAKCKNDEDILEIVLKTIMKNLDPKVTETQFEEILKVKSDEEKYEKFYEVSKEEKVYSFEYFKELVEGMKNRAIVGRDIDEKSFPILSKSSISLIRLTDPLISNIEDDYELSIFTKQKVNVEIVEASHAELLIKEETFKFLENSLEELI